MDDTSTLSALPGGGSALMIGAVAVLSRDSERSAVCRRCGRELARRRAGESAPRLRCSACQRR